MSSDELLVRLADNFNNVSRVPSHHLRSGKTRVKAIRTSLHHRGGSKRANKKANSDGPASARPRSFDEVCSVEYVTGTAL